ncbi:MAG: TRAP transporter large permease [Thermodesulfobacteriota bacterium]
MTEALVVIAISLIVLFSGMPLAFGFGVVAMSCGLLYGKTGPIDMLVHTMYGAVNSFELLTLPLFILMGIVIAHSPAGNNLYEAIHRLFSRLPGSLAMSNIWACSIFAAMCGSSPATAAAIGYSGIPEMRRRGVPDGLAVGSIVGGGTLGILIPPSITFIVYGIATETSIGKLFMAGVIPGIVITLMFSVYVYIVSLLSKKQDRVPSEKMINQNDRVVTAGTRIYTWSEKVEYLPKVFPFIILIALIIGSIYGGVATPSEAAAIGAGASILLVLTVYRKTLTLKSVMSIMEKTVNESAMIMLIAATSVLFQSVLTDLGITQKATVAITTLTANPWVVMLIINLLLLLLGCFMPPFAIILLTAPLLHPIILNLGFDPIWFGVIVTINMETGCITPPFGINLYVVKGIAPDIPMGRIIMGSMPFLIILVLGIVLLSLFPELALWLPGRMFGK